MRQLEDAQREISYLKIDVAVLRDLLVRTIRLFAKHTDTKLESELLTPKDPTNQ